MDERWLTVDDICKYLNVSNETVYKWIEQRSMPGNRIASAVAGCSNKMKWMNGSAPMALLNIIKRNPDQE